MRRFYKKQYQLPARKKAAQKPYQIIEQPAWDDTIHDLSKYRLSSEEQVCCMSPCRCHQADGAIVIPSDILKIAAVLHKQHHLTH